MGNTWSEESSRPYDCFAISRNTWIRLTSENAWLKEELRERDKLLNKYSTGIAVLDDRLYLETTQGSSLAHQVHVLNANLLKAQSKINRQEKEISERYNDWQVVRKEAEKFQNEVRIANRKNNEQEKKINQLTTENSRYTKQVKELQKKFSQQSKDGQTVLKAKAQISSQNKKIHQLIDENTSYTNQLEDVKIQLTRTEDDLIKRNAEIKLISNQHQTEVQKLNARLDELNEEANELADEAEELEKDLSMAKSQISSQSKKVNQLINANVSYAKKIDDLKSQLDTQSIRYKILAEKSLNTEHLVRNESLFSDDSKKKEPQNRKHNSKRKSQKTKSDNQLLAISESTKSIQNENGNQDSFECSVCGSEQSILNRTLFSPCGHGSCYKCGNQITNCHVCESKIIEKVKQFE